MARLTLVATRKPADTEPPPEPVLRVVDPALPYRAYEIWTQTEIARLCWRYGKGIDITELAVLHQRTVGAIVNRLRSVALI